MLKTIKSSLFKFCIALFALAALNMLIPVVNAQEPAQSGGGVVSGIVSDDQGPVIGAAVMVKGGTGGVTTDVDGHYVLKVVKPGDIVIFSLLGYEDLELA